MGESPANPGRLGGRWAELLDEQGKPALITAEGMVVNPARWDRAWVVLDPDDTERPTELCQVALDDPWLNPGESGGVRTRS